MEEVGGGLTLHAPAPELFPSFLTALEEFHAEGMLLEVAAPTLPAYAASLLARLTDVPPGRVPETVYSGVVDGEVVGQVSLRHHLVPHLERWGGHIGYKVRPGRRGRGHGHALLAAVLPDACALGLSRVLLHCDDANLASARIIEHAGGVFAGHTPNLEVPDRTGRAYWIEL